MSIEPTTIITSDGHRIVIRCDFPLSYSWALYNFVNGVLSGEITACEVFGVGKDWFRLTIDGKTLYIDALKTDHTICSGVTPPDPPEMPPDVV